MPLNTPLRQVHRLHACISYFSLVRDFWAYSDTGSGDVPAAFCSCVWLGVTYLCQDAVWSGCWLPVNVVFFRSCFPNCESFICKIRCLGCEDAEADYGKGLLLQPHRFISHRFSRLSLRHFTRVSLPKVLVARVEIFLRHEKCEARQPRITSQSWYGTMQLAAS